VKALHPTWYEHKPGEEINDMDLLDSLTVCFGKFEALGDLLVSANKNAMAKSTLANTGWLLIHTAEEAQHLVNQWHEQHGNVT